MTKDEFWKNFNLGTELQISGKFIYNGLYVFHQMKHFYYSEDIFEFLYNISVGIERLMKINLILIEHSETINHSQFEYSLKNHNHLELIKRIKKKHRLNFRNKDNEFLQLLFHFYKSHRYDRYSLGNVDEFQKEKKSLITYLEKHLNITISNENFNVTENNKRIKRFIGSIIKNISSSLYNVLRDEAHRLKIFTYEVRYNSKAFKIFIAEEFTFELEENIRKELLLSFIENKENTPFDSFLKKIKKLDFNMYEKNYYLKCILDILECNNLKGDLEVRYERVENI
ncbi:MAG: hypothetical protein OSB51_07510, partial [Dokdonia donghaensis]|nr:hypothetical protein [Dokdonia donghaensis]